MGASTLLLAGWAVTRLKKAQTGIALLLIQPRARRGVRHQRASFLGRWVSFTAEGQTDSLFRNVA